MNELLNKTIDLIKNKQENIDSYNIFNDLNIINFLTQIEYGEANNFISSLSNIEYPSNKEKKFPLSTEDLLFLINHTDINKLGTHENNYRASLSEWFIRHIEHFNKDKVHYTEIVKQINLRTDFNQKNGYCMNYLEIALTTNLYDNDNHNIIQIIEKSDVNSGTSPYGNTAIQNIVETKDSPVSTINFNDEWTESILNKLNFSRSNHNGDDQLDSIWKNKERVGQKFLNSVIKIAKSKIMEERPIKNLIIDIIFLGKKKDFFSEVEIMKFIDDYIEDNFSVNLFNKKEKLKIFAEKANVLIDYLKRTENLPTVLKEKIIALEEHPNSTTSYCSWAGESTQESLEYKKHVSDDLLNYILSKAELALNNSSELTKEKNKSLITETIKKIRVSVNAESHSNTIKNK